MNQKIQVKSGSNLLKVALDYGIIIDGTCQGRGTCGKCKVLITKGNSREYTAEEITHLTKEERSKGMRLACAVTVNQDTCVIVPKEYQAEESYIEKTWNKYKDGENQKIYGVVFDIGTTSVEAVLYDLATQEDIIRITVNNPQSIYGADVISRISYSNQREGNLSKLKKLIHDCCNHLIGQMIDYVWKCSQNKKKNLIEDSEIINRIGYNRIHKCVFLGNTIMSHLFLGKDVNGLSRTPFSPAYTGMVSWNNEKEEFHMNRQGEVIVLPGLSGQVGSDTLGCILATDLIHQKGKSLMIDIGTNSEIVLAEDGNMICCSTAAGPAFEGASIYQGMRANKGGIKGVRIREDQLELDVIGEEFPIGICGSGIIDLIGELVEEGIIDETGRIVSVSETDSLLRHRIIEGIGNEFLLFESLGKASVKVIQKDIREVQMAKGAIYAGIMALLEERHLTPDQLDRVYLAGAFGNNINIQNAIKIGLLPEISLEKFKLIGNGSLEGGALFLLSKVSKEEVISISEQIQHLELAYSDSFRELFIQSMNLKRIKG